MGRAERWLINITVITTIGLRTRRWAKMMNTGPVKRWIPVVTVKIDGLKKRGRELFMKDFRKDLINNESLSNNHR